MTLIDTDRAEALYAAMGQGDRGVRGLGRQHASPGMASFGGRAAYIGRVFDDQLGAVFAHDLRAAGVTFRCPPATDGPPTGRCLIVVTPDAQRTMNTYLGLVGVPRPGGRRRRPHRGRPDHLPRGLPLRPPRVAGGVLEGQSGRPRGGPARQPHPVGHVLRRAPQGGLAVARHRPGRHPVRQRGRGDGALRRRPRSTR